MKIEKNKRYCFIVESPNKVKTISQIFKEAGYSNIFVFASVGHITKLNDSGEYNMGIDVHNDFKADYVIADGKQEIVKKLKEQVKLADKVIIATDPDREGEAIAWHLYTVLKIPKSKLERVVYHEISKKAILSGIENSRALDLDLIASAITRQKIDRIIGYRLSNLARKTVKARSVGRCQSAGLKVIVLRDEEIQNFIPETYFDAYVNFSKNNVKFKAKYIGTDKNKIDHLSKVEEFDALKKACAGNPYVVKNIEKKEAFDNPKPAFTTSTFQQEVSKKLGISVKQAMEYAQRLFEGIDIKGRHVALVTYLRTDDPNIAPEFIPELKTFIENRFGKEYYKEPKKIKLSEDVQAGHECFRVIDLNMTPELLDKYITDKKLLTVYTLIYKRTLAAAFQPAKISNTIYSIYNKDNKFTMVSRELTFDGYKRIYDYKEDKDDSDDLIKEVFKVGENLENTTLTNVKKETKPPLRYTEGSFVKELEKQGIGRPSTYSNIVDTLLNKNRNYCVNEGKDIVPCDLGVELSHFLDKSFPDIISISYTRELEKDLDLIACGKLDSIDFLEGFYKKLEDSISKVSGEGPTIICPKCGAKMVLRNGPYNRFYGCSNYPKCKNTAPVPVETAQERKTV